MARYNRSALIPSAQRCGPIRYVRSVTILSAKRCRLIRYVRAIRFGAPVQRLSHRLSAALSDTVQRFSAHSIGSALPSDSVCPGNPIWRTCSALIPSAQCRVVRYGITVRRLSHRLSAAVRFGTTVQRLSRRLSAQFGFSIMDTIGEKVADSIQRNVVGFWTIFHPNDPIQRNVVGF